MEVWECWYNSDYVWNYKPFIILSISGKAEATLTTSGATTLCCFCNINWPPPTGFTTPWIWPFWIKKLVPGILCKGNIWLNIFKASEGGDRKIVNLRFTLNTIKLNLKQKLPYRLQPEFGFLWHMKFYYVGPVPISFFFLLHCWKNFVKSTIYVFGFTIIIQKNILFSGQKPSSINFCMWLRVWYFMEQNFVSEIICLLFLWVLCCNFSTFVVLF